MTTRPRTRLTDLPPNAAQPAFPATVVRPVAGTVRHANRVRLTQTMVEKFTVPAGEQRVVYRDEEVRGFGIVVGQTSNSWFVERRLGPAGNPAKRVIDTTDKMPSLSIARNIARQWLIQMKEGIDPHAVRKELVAKRKIDEAEAERRAKTLREVLGDWVQKPGRPKSIQDVKYTIETRWHDYLDKPISSITSDGVIARFCLVHTEVAKRQAAAAKKRNETPDPHAGHSSANKAVRSLSLLLNLAIAREWLTKNPADVVKRAKLFHPDHSRDDQLLRHQYPVWFQALETVRSGGGRLERVGTDLFEFILLTGLRENTARQLRWEWIKWEDRLLVVPPTKHKSGGHDDAKPERSVRVPLTERHLALLTRRKEESKRSPWVFPSTKDEKKHVVEVMGVAKRMVDAGAPYFSEHPLRRSFGAAARMAGVGYIEIKRLMGHAINKSDPTEANYVGTVADAELRAAMEATVRMIDAMAAPPTQTLRITNVA